jgi:outer membrane lipoprotein-sorting protein
LKPASLVRAVVLVLLLFAGLHGCRAVVPPAPPPTLVASAGDLLTRLQHRQQSFESFQARGRITFLSPQRNYSGTALLKVRRPAGLRVDILDILGRRLLSFATNGEQVQILSPHENKFFQGRASPGNLAAFIPPSVSLTQAVRLLMGALPLSSGPPSRFEFDSVAGQYLLEWQKGSRLEERLRVAAQGLYPVQEEYFGGAAQPRFTAELADFGEAAPDFPGKITLKSEAPKLELWLAYTELRLNPPLPEAAWTLTPPPGVTVVPLP